MAVGSDPPDHCSPSSSRDVFGSLGSVWITNMILVLSADPGSDKPARGGGRWFMSPALEPGSSSPSACHSEDLRPPVVPASFH